MQATMNFKVTEHKLSDDHSFYSGMLPDFLLPSNEQFEELWGMHPNEYRETVIYGRPVKNPRWEQAYEQDYRYTGDDHSALPATPFLRSLLQWSQEQIDDRQSGILCNWYDSKLKHYIGAHRDSTINIVPDSPIVTISFGEERLFRLRPWKGQGYLDFPASNGTVFVMPYATNEAWTHEVPHFTRYQGRRISVTLRAFVLSNAA